MFQNQFVLGVWMAGIATIVMLSVDSNKVPRWVFFGVILVCAVGLFFIFSDIEVWRTMLA